MKIDFLKKKENETQLNNLKQFNNIKLAKYVFKLMFGTNFDLTCSNFFYNNIFKLNWLKKHFLNKNVYYKKIFANFFMKFTVNYILSPKKTKPLHDYLYDLVAIIVDFITKIFCLQNLNEKAQINFIDFVFEKLKFNLILKAIMSSHFKVKNRIDFYIKLNHIFNNFLNSKFDMTQHNYVKKPVMQNFLISFENYDRDLRLDTPVCYTIIINNNNRKLSGKTYVKYNHNYEDDYSHVSIIDDFWKQIKFTNILYYTETVQKLVINQLMRNRFSSNCYSLDDLYFIYKNYNLFYYDCLPYLYFQNIQRFKLQYLYYDPLASRYKYMSRFKLKKSKSNKSLASSFKEVLKVKFYKKKQKYVLNLLSKKFKQFQILKDKKKYRKIVLSFLKNKRINSLVSVNIKNYNKFFFKKLVFLKKNLNLKIEKDKNIAFNTNKLKK